MSRFLFLFVFLVSCSSFQGGSRDPAMDADYTDERTGEVVLFYKEGNYAVIKSCKRGRILSSRGDCEVESGGFDRRVLLSEFKESLKSSLSLRGNFSKNMREKIDLYRSERRDDAAELLKIQRERGLLEIQRGLKEEISDLQEFVSELGSGSNTPIVRELSKLKSRLSEVESELADLGELDQVIKGINDLVDELVDEVISSDKLKRYTSESGFMFNILKSYLTAHLFSSTFKRISVDKINDLAGGKSFKMGSPGNEKDRDDDEYQVAVSISKDYEIMTKEVTQRQWFEVTGKNPSHFKTEDDCDNHMRIGDVEMCPDNPVERVTWNEIDELFVKKLNIAKGLTGCDGTPSSQRGCLRLPTEAEWENAARCGTTTAYSFGNDPDLLPSYGIYTINSNLKTHPVGSLRANPCDLYDVHGNVEEWVQDRYKRGLLGGTDPLQTSGLNRVVRGGSWSYDAPYLRSASRNGGSPGFRFINVGFRLVRTL